MKWFEHTYDMVVFRSLHYSSNSRVLNSSKLLGRGFRDSCKERVAVVQARWDGEMIVRARFALSKMMSPICTANHSLTIMVHDTAWDTEISPADICCTVQYYYFDTAHSTGNICYENWALFSIVELKTLNRNTKICNMLLLILIFLFLVFGVSSYINFLFLVFCNFNQFGFLSSVIYD